MRKTLPRLFAALLATGGIAWALILLAFAFSNGWSSIFGVTLYFGFGYLVWAGWIARAFATPRFSFRVAIWSGSIICHIFYLLSTYRDFSGHNGALLVYWWVIALVLSIISLVLERREEPIQPPQTTTGSSAPSRV